MRASIFSGAHMLGGSLGASIVVVSTLVRLALLPLMLRSARQARAQQALLATLKPQLEALQQRHKANPQRLFTETQALYRAHGIRFMRPTGLVSLAVQLPLLGALFSAVRAGLGDRVRFLWILDLGRADATLAVIVALLSGLTVIAAPPAPASPIPMRTMAFGAATATLFFLWSASGAVALSVGAGSAVGVLQNWLLRRDARRGAAV